MKNSKQFFYYFVIIVLSSFIIPCLSFAQTHIPPGEVSGTWTIDGSPYIVDGHINVPKDSLLSIDPEVCILFSDWYYFRVYGTLLAEGTETDSILFSVIDTTDSYATIIFCDLDTTFQDSSRLTHCIVDHGYITFSNSSIVKVKHSIVTNGLGIGFNNSNSILDNVIVRNNTSSSYGGGITCTENSCPRLVNVRVVGNSAMWGGGISCRFDSNPTLEGVTIMNNTAQAIGGGMFCEESNPYLYDVTITGNSEGGITCYDNANPILENVTISNNEDCGGLFCTNSSPTLINVTITNNRSNESGGGIYCQGYDEGNSDLYLKNVTITGNEAYNWGGGMYVQYSDVVIVNSLITNNITGGGGGICCCCNSTMALANVTITGNSAYLGGGIQIEYDSNMHLENCILWGDEPEETFIATGAYVSANYCDIEGGAAGTGNINSDPLFADTLLYHLSEDSPCIDAGNPDTMYYDIEDPENPGFALYPAMGTLHNDIGAYGGHGKYEPILSTDDPPHSQSMNINNYPNPFNTSTTISFYRTPNIHKEAQIEIYNLKGQKVIELLIVSQSQSPQVSVTWDGKDNRGKKVGPGIYFIYMKTGKNVNVKKIVKLGL